MPHALTESRRKTSTFQAQTVREGADAEQAMKEAPGESGSVQLATKNYIPGGDKN